MTRRRGENVSSSCGRAPPRPPADRRAYTEPRPLEPGSPAQAARARRDRAPRVPEAGCCCAGASNVTLKASAERPSANCIRLAPRLGYPPRCPASSLVPLRHVADLFPRARHSSAEVPYLARRLRARAGLPVREPRAKGKRNPRRHLRAHRSPKPEAASDDRERPPSRGPPPALVTTGFRRRGDRGSSPRNPCHGRDGERHRGLLTGHDLGHLARPP